MNSYSTEWNYNTRIPRNPVHVTEVEGGKSVLPSMLSSYNHHHLCTNDNANFDYVGVGNESIMGSSQQSNNLQYTNDAGDNYYDSIVGATTNEPFEEPPMYDSRIDSGNMSCENNYTDVIGMNHTSNVIGNDDVVSDNDDDEISTLEVLYRIECVVAMIIEALDALLLPEMIQYEDYNTLALQQDEMSSSLVDKSSSFFTNSSSATMKKRFTLQQSRSFSSMVLVLAYCHKLLQGTTDEYGRIRTTTTREVYYYYITHFRNQRECDMAIWDVCTILQVPRHTLGLQASSRGWFCGDIQLVDHLHDGTTTIQWDGRTYRGEQGCPISSDWLLPSKKRSFVLNKTTSATCIVIVEKEGIYQRLVQDGIWYQQNCILITGKGFPDLATRACVHTLHHQLQLPVYGLADCDPFGVAVLHCYSFGSVGGAAAGEATTGTTTSFARRRNGGCGDRYAVPLQWLGLRPSQIELLSKPTIFGDVTLPALPSSVYQALTDIDRKRLVDHFWNEIHPFVWNQHPARMQELRDMISMKVELEALYWLGMNFCSIFVSFLLEQARRQRQMYIDDELSTDNANGATSKEWSWIDSI